jgi:hypothetical protein
MNEELKKYVHLYLLKSMADKLEALEKDGINNFVEEYMEQTKRDLKSIMDSMDDDPELPSKLKLPDPTQFRYLDCVIGGDECWLINPDSIKCKWDEDNLKFRSIIIRKSDHKIISTGWKKFFNFFEKPDLDPFPNEGFTARAKHDGSLLCLGIHNGEIIERTRGSVSVSSLPNGDEIEFLRQKYPKLWAAIQLNPNHSILCEWETPNHVIVLRRVTEPTLTLIGVIDNNTLNYLPQDELDTLAESWGVERPKQYHFDTVEDCIKDVKLWENAEGVVLYSADGQHLRKIKASLYCQLHKILSGMKSIGNVLDVFMESPKFEKLEDFYNFMKTSLDWEVAEYCKESIEEICQAYRNVLDKIKKADNVIEGLRGLTRKEQAIDIQRHYSDWRKGYCFTRIDGKEMDDKMLRKAIEHELEI